MLKEYLVGVCGKNGKVCTNCPAHDICIAYGVDPFTMSEEVLDYAIRRYFYHICECNKNNCSNCPITKTCDLTDYFLYNIDASPKILLAGLRELYEEAEKEPEKTEEPVTAQNTWAFMKWFANASDELIAELYPMRNPRSNTILDDYTPEEAVKILREYMKKHESKPYEPKRFEVVEIDGQKAVFLGYSEDGKRIQYLGKGSSKYVKDIIHCNAQVANHTIKFTGAMSGLEKVFE